MDGFSRNFPTYNKLIIRVKDFISLMALSYLCTKNMNRKEKRWEKLLEGLDEYYSEREKLHESSVCVKKEVINGKVFHVFDGTTDELIKALNGKRLEDMPWTI